MGVVVVIVFTVLLVRVCGGPCPRTVGAVAGAFSLYGLCSASYVARQGRGGDQVDLSFEALRNHPVWESVFLNSAVHRVRVHSCPLCELLHGQEVSVAFRRGHGYRWHSDYCD